MRPLIVVRRHGFGDVTSSLTSGITDTAVAAMLPPIHDMMMNEVLPMLMVAVVAGSVLSATVGSWFASRPSRSGIRSNPHRRRRRYA